MMYEDKFGNLMVSDEVEELSLWEIEQFGIHVFDVSKMPGLW